VLANELFWTGHSIRLLFGKKLGVVSLSIEMLAAFREFPQM